MRAQGPSEATAGGESDRRGDAATVMYHLEKDSKGGWRRVYFAFKFNTLA